MGSSKFKYFLLILTLVVMTTVNVLRNAIESFDQYEFKVSLLDSSAVHLDIPSWNKEIKSTSVSRKTVAIATILRSPCGDDYSNEFIQKQLEHVLRLRNIADNARKSFRVKVVLLYSSPTYEYIYSRKKVKGWDIFTQCLQQADHSIMVDQGEEMMALWNLNYYLNDYNLSTNSPVELDAVFYLRPGYEIDTAKIPYNNSFQTWLMEIIENQSMLFDLVKLEEAEIRDLQRHFPKTKYKSDKGNPYGYNTDDWNQWYDKFGKQREALPRLLELRELPNPGEIGFEPVSMLVFAYPWNKKEAHYSYKNFGEQCNSKISRGFVKDTGIKIQKRAFAKRITLEPPSFIHEWTMSERKDISICATNLLVTNMTHFASTLVQKYNPSLLKKKPKQVIMFRAHKYGKRTSKTLARWYHDASHTDTEVVAVVPSNGNRTIRDISSIPGAPLRTIWVKTDLIQKLLPLEAIEKYEEASTLPNKYRENKMQFAGHQFGIPTFYLDISSSRTKWIFCQLTWSPVLSFLLEDASFSDVEYFWFIDYDVTFTGNITSLLEITRHDDSDLLSVSMLEEDTINSTNIFQLEEEDLRKDNWTWWNLGKLWSGQNSRRAFASTMRLSRRMIRWCLEAMFTPTNFAIDELFFRSLCHTNTQCKYRPLQSFKNKLGYPLVSFHTYGWRSKDQMLISALRHHSTKDQLWHSIKRGSNIYKGLETWFE